MINSPRIVVITTLILTLSFFLILTQTNAHTNPKHETSQTPTHAPTNPHINPKHAQSPQNPTNNAQSPSPTNTPNNPNPKSPSSPITKQNDTSPYHVANHFCLSRRLDVQSTFCLKVLRSSPTSADAQNNKDLLYIAAYSAIDFGNKTTLLLQKLSEDKSTPAPVIEECLSAYKGYIAQYNVLVQEGKSETRLASYDAELAKNEINRCVKAVDYGTKNAEIGAQNEIAMDYAKLTQNIADSNN